MGYKQQLERLKVRDARLYQYHLDNPLIGVRDLGRIFKISHGRVSQILRAIKDKIAEDGELR